MPTTFHDHNSDEHPAFNFIPEQHRYSVKFALLVLVGVVALGFLVIII